MHKISEAKLIRGLNLLVGSDRSPMWGFLLIVLLVSASNPLMASQGGVAATAHPLATEAALKMLSLGGNAVDAAVAAGFAIGVVEPDGSGLGGGGGILVYMHESQSTKYINYYHQAPSDPGAIGFNSAKDRNTAKSVLVPGTVAGLCHALEQYGKLSLQVVIEPALRYAQDGFPVDATLAGLLLDNMEALSARPELAEIFLVEGFPKMQGDLLQQPKLARVLQLISDHGPDGFYTGETAQALVDGLVAQGGVMTLEDLANFEPMTNDPVYGTYRDVGIVSAPPPHSGVTLIEIMNMMEKLEFDSGVHYTDSAKLTHMMSEIFRRSYADRSQYLGDPRFVSNPVAGLTSKLYARKIFSEINRFRGEPRNYRDTPYGLPARFDGEPAITMESFMKPRGSSVWSDEGEDDPGLNSRFNDPFDRWSQDDESTLNSKKKTPAARRGSSIDEDEFDGGHTTHLSVIDGDSNMVALTQTLGNFFGSKVMINGILLNNGRVNFSSKSKSNFIAPNRRPRSSLTPTLLFQDGAPFLSLGSPGAGRIIATVAQIIVNLVDYDMDVQEANHSPRIFCQKFDDYLYLESRVGDDVAEKLTRMGHAVRVLGEMDLFFGGVQMTAIWPKTGEFVGSADPRRGGSSKSLQIDSSVGGGR